MVILPPQNIPAELSGVGIAFTMLERVGQVGCLLIPVISKTNFQNRSINLWIVLSLICIACYYGLWIRYTVTGRDFTTLFSPVLIPIPMAVLPVLAFGFMAIWSKSVWLGLTDMLFAIGHLANSWNTYNYMK
jgi:hypothetical protein